MLCLVEFDGNGTDPEIPSSNVVGEVVELAVQLFVDGLDFASEFGGLDVFPSKARTKLKNRISGIREDPEQVVLALAQRALRSGCQGDRPHMGNLESALIIDDPLVAQLFEELADVGANLDGIGFAELGLQFCDDLGEGSLAVTALQDLSPCSL